MKKNKEITTKTPEELNKTIVDARERVRAIRFGAAGSRTRNTRESRTTRREIARTLTELRARTLPSAIAKTVKTA